MVSLRSCILLLTAGLPLAKSANRCNRREGLAPLLPSSSWPIALFVDGVNADGSRRISASPRCSGSLIERAVVLTSAGCFTMQTGQPVDAQLVRASFDDPRRRDQPAEELEPDMIAARQIEIHPNASRSNPEYDLAVVFLSIKVSHAIASHRLATLPEAATVTSSAPRDCRLQSWMATKTIPCGNITTDATFCLSSSEANTLCGHKQGAALVCRAARSESLAGFQSAMSIDEKPGQTSYTLDATSKPWDLMGILSTRSTAKACRATTAIMSFANVSQSSEWLYSLVNVAEFLEDEATLAACGDGSIQCYTHQVALALLRSADIKVEAKGRCSDQSVASCTSLDGLRALVISGPSGLLQMRRLSQCPFLVAGGTERNDANLTATVGWSITLDDRNACLSKFIRPKFRAAGSGENEVRCDSSGIEFRPGRSDDKDIVFINYDKDNNACK